MPYPADARYFPKKDEIADYMEAYAAQNQLPVKSNTRVDKLTRDGGYYMLTSGEQCFRTKNVIVATGAFQSPYIPSFANELDPSILQLHSKAYRNPEQLTAGHILVVGAGNSGAEIALELSKAGRQVWLSGRDVGHIPANQLGKLFRGRPYWWFISNVLTINTPIGRKIRDQVLHHGNPLIRTDRKEVMKAGVQFSPRLSGVSAGKPRWQDGQSFDVNAVVWATGFRPSYEWIDLPIFNIFGLPNHQRGIVPETRGLYFVGLHFQTGLTSSLISGVGRDAQYICSQLQ
jgi:putative flavoprotein involved in K+ transport